MSIKNMFGDLKSIDIMAESKDGKSINLMLVCNGKIDGSAETQTALLDKMEGYLGHIKSEEFTNEHKGKEVILTVTFTERPDDLILDLLYKCQNWCLENGAVMQMEIDGKKVRFTN